MDAASLCVLISTESRGGANLDIDIADIQVRAPFMASLFEGPRFFYVSPEIVSQSALNGGRSNVLIDWSFSFDSNVAQKIRAYVNGENISEPEFERVETLLRLKKEYSIQVDLVPFLFENLRLSRDDSQNERPLNTLMAFKALDHLDWEAFERDPRRPVIMRPWEELRQEAEVAYNSLVSDEAVIVQEEKALFATAFLFGLAEKWLQYPKEKEKAFSELIDYCLSQLGRLPLYEVSLAWDFLSKPQALRFFGPLAGLSKNLLRDLRGMAWDLNHIRALETMATQQVRSGFFLPFFVSFDRRLVELLEHNRTRHLIVDRHSERVQSVRARDWDAQVAINDCMSLKARKLLGQTNREAKQRECFDADYLRKIITEKERSISCLLNDG